MLTHSVSSGLRLGMAQHDLALNKIQDIMGLFLYKPLPLPETIDDARALVPCTFRST